MSEMFLPNVPIAERVRTLKETSDKVEKITFNRVLTEEEMEELRLELANLMIKIDEIGDERKAFLEELKEKLKPLKLHLDSVMACLKTSSEQVTEEVYMIADHEAGMMASYDQRGVRIEYRRLHPSERQTVIKNLKDA